MPKGKPVTNRMREEMRRLRAERMPLDDIGALLGVSGRCVLTYTADMDVQVDRPGRAGRGGKRTAAQNARLLAAKQDGLSNEEIADRFRLAPKSVGPTLWRLRRQIQEHRA
ncbi:hypothetical protein [uncultured Variovorax sp.]|uniref:hypothetical protein n=1 Tax=uncultured Variovorax sp. TaxID=114708 RepID=UPI00260DE2BF|nr:hypothetical protein [uncultured Variovorax sp.]